VQEPEILCVGEAPGRQEAHDLKPFVGPSGQLIRKMLLSAGFDPVKQAWANAVMCFPQAQPDPSKSDNPAYVEPTRGTFETPDKKDAQVCTQQNLLPLIDRLRPKSILCLGAVATSIFFDSRLKDVSGQAKTWNGIPVISTYHPSYVLRSPEKESVLRKDIQKLRVMLYPQGLRRKFFVVRDREMLERARRWLEEKMRPGTLRVGTDIETNTLDPLDPHALIKCVGFGDDKQAYTIFINQKDPVYNEQAVEYVRWLLARPDIVHSFCRSWFDVKFLLSKGITVNRFEDIQAKAFLLNENRYEYGLKELSLEYIGEYTNTMNDKDEEELGRYCGEDASNTYILDGIFDAKLRPGLRQVHDKVMMPMVPVINEMMLTGIKINKEYAKSLEKVVEKESADLREKLSKDYPVFNGINIHSPDQLQRIVYRVLNMKPTIKTKTGYSVGEPVLSHFAEEGQRWAQLILDIRGKDKLLSTYVKAIPRQVSFDGRIRTEYNLIGARTGRLCVSPDTLIEMPRDMEKYPNGVPLRQVKPGDWVYSFDWEGCLCLRQVKWVGPTKIADTISIDILDKKTGKITNLVCTSDHLVRLNTGTWKPAGKLKPGEALMGMVRRGIHEGKYYYFFPTARRRNKLNKQSTTGGRVKEHRWVYAQTIGRLNMPSQWDVHHKDERTFNNSVDNFEFCYHPDHMKMHNPGWAREDIEQFIKYPSTWKFKPESLRSAARRVGIKKPRSFFIKLFATNHNVMRVAPSGVREVWDLEVEDTHTFIGSDVALHNSSKAPNLQNIARDDKIYRMFIADRNKQFFYFDFSQLELRVGCSVAEEEKMIAAFKEGRDLHMQTACMVYNKEQKDIAPEERQVAKSINFGLLYGMSERGLKEYLFLKAGVDVSAEEAQVMHQRFFQLYTGLTAWYRRVEQELMSKCRIVYKTGRIRRFPQMRGARQIPPDVFNQAVNCGVQGAASDLVLFSTASFFRLVKKRKLPAKFVLTVHDSVILEIEKDEGLVEELTELINMVIKDKVPQDPMFSWVRVPLEVDVKVGPTWGDLQKAKK